MTDRASRITEGFDLAALGFLLAVLMIVLWGGLSMALPAEVPITSLYRVLQYFVGGGLVLGGLLLLVRLAQWMSSGGDR